MMFTEYGIKIGWLHFRYYALCYIIALVVVTYLILKRACKLIIETDIKNHGNKNSDVQSINNNSDIQHIYKNSDIQHIYNHLWQDIDRILQYSFIAGVLGGRFGDLILDCPEHFTILQSIFDGLISVPWSGMDFKCGMFTATVTCIVMLWRNSSLQRNINITLDSIAIYAPIGIMIGRFGNFLNHEFDDIVDICNIQMPLSIFAMLTEGLCSSIIMQIINIFNIRYKSIYFFIIYSIMRFINDIYRSEPNIIYSINRSQIICLCIFSMSLLYLLVVNTRLRKA